MNQYRRLIPPHSPPAERVVVFKRAHVDQPPLLFQPLDDVFICVLKGAKSKHLTVNGAEKKRIKRFRYIRRRFAVRWWGFDQSNARTDHRKPFTAGRTEGLFQIMTKGYIRIYKYCDQSQYKFLGISRALSGLL